MMRRAPRLLAVTASLLAAAIVYSPLLAALASAGDAPRDAIAIADVGVRAPLLRSIAIALVAACVGVLLGVPFALVVDRAARAVRRLCWAAAALALVVPPYVVAESSIVLFGPAGKLSRGVALAIGYGPPDAVGRARYAVPGVVFTAPAAGTVIGGCLFPIVAFAVAAAIRRTDRRLFESARLMRGRAGVVHVAFHALALPTLGGALVVFALALTESIVPQLLRVPAIGEAINESISLGDIPAAARRAAAMTPIVLLAGACGGVLLTRRRAASLAGLEGDVPTHHAPQSSVRVSAAAVLVAFASTSVGLLTPAIGLGWLAFAAPRGAASAKGFLDSFRSAWSLAHDDAARTLALAVVAATLAIVLAYGVARRARGVVVGLLAAGVAVPGSIVGLGLIALWNRTAGRAVFEGEAVVVLAWLARFLPVAAVLVHAALRRVPRELEEAAALAGRGPLARFVDVVLPAAAPGLAAAWAAVYVLSATECVATLLLSPPGRSFLAPSVVNLIRRGQDPEIAACQSLLLAVVIAPLLALGAVVLVATRRRAAS